MQYNPPPQRSAARQIARDAQMLALSGWRVSLLALARFWPSFGSLLLVRRTKPFRGGLPNDFEYCYGDEQGDRGHEQTDAQLLKMRAEAYKERNRYGGGQRRPGVIFELSRSWLPFIPMSPA